MTIGLEFPRVLDAARLGSEWAVTALYRDLSGPVLRYLSVQAGGDAEDIASEAWIDVARGLHRFQGDESAFRRYVFAIAHRRLVDHHRKNRRRRSRPVPAEVLERHSPNGDVEDEAMRGFSAHDAMELIARLPRDQAQVVLLRVLGGMSAEEVGRLLGKRAGAVRVIQHRALARLAAELSDPDVTRERLGAM